MAEAKSSTTKTAAVQVSPDDLDLSNDQADALRINPLVIHLASREAEKRKRVSEQPRTSPRLSVRPHVTRYSIENVAGEDCYPTDYPERGTCLIIEYDAFKPQLGLAGRKGSDADVKVTRQCFVDMGFTVHLQRNLTFQELTRLLEQTAALDHSRCDCFALVIMSHGNEGTVFAHDGPFPTQKLWEPFTADRAPSLAGKPKMIFIQACQGNKMDPGMTVHKATPIRGSATATDSFASYKMPVHADFLIAHSTVSGYFSWRNTLSGSWYMQSLAKVLGAERGSRDILTILTMTNKVVGLEYESTSSTPEYNHKKQTPFIYSTLMAKLYLEDKEAGTKAD